MTEDALWASLRALQEKEAMLCRLSAVQAAEKPGSELQALNEAGELASVIAVLRRLAEQVPSNKSFTAPSR